MPGELTDIYTPDGITLEQYRRISGLDDDERQADELGPSTSPAPPMRGICGLPS